MEEYNIGGPMGIEQFVFLAQQIADRSGNVVSLGTLQV
jgi:hypothetical protein